MAACFLVPSLLFISRSHSLDIVCTSHDVCSFLVTAGLTIFLNLRLHLHHSHCLPSPILLSLPINIPNTSPTPFNMMASFSIEPCCCMDSRGDWKEDNSLRYIIRYTDQHESLHCSPKLTRHLQKVVLAPCTRSYHLLEPNPVHPIIA